MDPTSVDFGEFVRTPHGSGVTSRASGGRADDETGSGSDSDRSSILVADATLSGGDLALSATLDRAREAVLIPDHHTVSPAGERTLFVSATGVPAARLTDAFALDPSVVDADHVSDFPDCEMYSLRLVESAVLLAPTSVELGARTRSVRGAGGAWHARIQFPDREALVALRQFCNERGIRFGIDSLYRTDQLQESQSDLTDRQRRALRVAFDSGYYDVPRQVTQDDLAAELDISTSAVSHLLRRATAGLVGESLDELGDGSDRNDE